jgi:hypothetical protein
MIVASYMLGGREQVVAAQEVLATDTPRGRRERYAK